MNGLNQMKTGWLIYKMSLKSNKDCIIKILELEKSINEKLKNVEKLIWTH